MRARRSPAARPPPARRLLSLLGRRLPTTAGTLCVSGLSGTVTVRRDGYGIPHIEAAGDADAAYALGFCQGQDRAFQLETIIRVVRGTLAALVGPRALAADRLARRIDFRRDADTALARSRPETRREVAAFSDGLTAGAGAGLRRRPHELALLRARPTPWSPADVVGVTRLMAFLLPTNWDQELVRLRLVAEDGPAAVRLLDPPYPPDGPAQDRPGRPAGAGADDPLVDDLRAFARTVGPGGGSNAWALDGTRTASRAPLLAGDPHLRPTLPPHWYLAHVRTPDLSVAGATFVGLPSVLAGHNGHAAWAPTSAPIDNTDLVLEDLDGGRVRRGAGPVPCRRRTETIRVRGDDAVTIEVLETPEGPIVSPELATSRCLSLRATWLEPHPLDGLALGAQRAGTFDDFRAAYRDWAGMPLNLVYADRAGVIGWQTVGRVPRRRGGHGVLPTAGWQDGGRWEDTHVPFEQLPRAEGSEAGFVVSANHLPRAEDAGGPLGRDWADVYRARRIEMVLGRRCDWDVGRTQELQRDVVNLAWWDLRDAVLAAPVADAHGRLGRALLADWDGRVAPDRVGATVFEFLVAALVRRLAEAAAPTAARWALGAGVSPLTRTNDFPKRCHTLLVRLVTADDPGPLDRPWPDEIAAALRAVVGELRDRYGPDPRGWTWGRVRAWSLPHALGTRPLLARAFNLGPLPGLGDQVTPAQHAGSLTDPGAPPRVCPSLRLVVDLADVEASRFALPGGQSGNPCSPHYADQLGPYLGGGGVPIPWHPEAVRAASRSTLRLRPG